MTAWDREHDKAARLAALTDAVRALRDARLEHEYVQAVVDWEEGDDTELWERTASDGI
jgi:hypothetical protein